MVQILNSVFEFKRFVLVTVFEYSGDAPQAGVLRPFLKLKVS